MRLVGKVAVVTGGTSGIGRAIVERFSLEGAQVVFSGRREEAGGSLAASTGATFIQGDAADEDHARALIASAVQRNHRVDILVNNAGSTFPLMRLETLPLEMLDAAFALMARGPLAHIKHVSALMRAQRRGSIINIASIAGHRVGYSGSICYEVAKAALIHLTRHLAMELGEDGVRANSISPGGIATGIFAKSLGMAPDEADRTEGRLQEYLADKQAIPRAGQPSDIANLAVFLASDESAFINGEDIVVDGGLIWGRRYSEMVATVQGLKAWLE